MVAPCPWACVARLVVLEVLLRRTKLQWMALGTLVAQVFVRGVELLLVEVHQWVKEVVWELWGRCLGCPRRMEEHAGSCKLEEDLWELGQPTGSLGLGEDAWGLGRVLWLVALVPSRLMCPHGGSDICHHGYNIRHVPNVCTP